jgi:hypothetical protein
VDACAIYWQIVVLRLDKIVQNYFIISILQKIPEEGSKNFGRNNFTSEKIPEDGSKNFSRKH